MASLFPDFREGYNFAPTATAVKTQARAFDPDAHIRSR
jgi:hypothetical protein